MTTTLDRTVRTSAPVSPLRRAAAPTLIGLLGLAISLAGAGIPSIWYDEAATISSSLRTWPQLLAEIGTVDLVHAAYYAGMHVWFDLVGYSPVTLRLPSAVAIGVAATVLVAFGRVLSRPRLGVLAGLVFVLLPRTTWAGAEGRSYALTALLAIALTLLLVVATRDGRRRWWVLYAALGALSVVVFIYLALVLLAHAVTVFWARHSARRLPVRRWLVASAAAAVVGIPFVLATATQRGQVEWLPTIGPRFWSRVGIEQWFFSSDAFAVVGWVGIAIGIVVLVRGRGRGLSLARLALPAALLPTCALVIATAVAVPLYTPRYLTMCLPFVALLIAAAIDALPRRRFAVIAVALLVALAIPQVVEQRQPRAKEHTDWAAVAALIAEQRAREGADAVSAVVFDTVQRHPRATSRVIAYAYPEAFEGVVDVTLDVPAADSGRLWETTIPLDAGLPRLAGADTVFLITSPGDDGSTATTAELAPLGWRVVDRWIVSEAIVLQYAR